MFTFSPKLIYKGKLARTLQEKTDFAAAHAQKTVTVIPAYTLDDIQEGFGHLDHDIQLNNIEQQLNRFILDYGEAYTVNIILDLLQSIKR